MACFEPLQAWKSHVMKTENGKPIIAFKREQVSHLPYEEITLPCGKCIGCLFDRSKQWAVRCVHEAQLHDQQNCFITLTFNDEYLYSRRHDCRRCEVFKRRKIKREEVRFKTGDYETFIKNLRSEDGDFRPGDSERIDQERSDETELAVPCHTASLCKRDFTLFMKRLRKALDVKIRFFHVGEYGTKLGRPHHHVLIFGWKPKILNFQSYDSKTGVTLYTTPELTKEIWPYGFHTVGTVNWRTAAYCSRYCLKKINGDRAKHHYWGIDKETGEYAPIEPEYITMSRRPGIGAEWFRKYQSDVYPADGLHIEGRPFKTPRFYDKLYEKVAPVEYARIKRKRLTAAKKNASENSYNRRRSKRIIAEKNLLKLERKVENESQRLCNL